MAQKLEQTKGKIKLEGKVVGITNENAYREGFTTSEKPFKSLAFFVETSPVNKVKVEIFGMEREQVSAYSQKAKETKKVAWADRHGNHGDFKVLGVNMFLEKGSDGKNTRKVLVEYDAIDYIQQHLKEGDSVRINGEPDFQEFENQEGQKKESVKFTVKSISKLDEEIYFTSENFKEVSMFEQEIIATDVMVDDESKKLIVGAKVIKYNGDHVNATLVVDGNNLPKLANNMAKRLSFGDSIKVFGLIINSTIKKEVEAGSDIVTDDDDWGGDDEIKNSMETSYITDYINELQITSVDSTSYEKKKYNEEDFFNEDEEAFDGNVEEEDFSDESEIEDLPF